jgi:hypothetical protein
LRAYLGPVLLQGKHSFASKWICYCAVYPGGEENDFQNFRIIDINNWFYSFQN